MGTGKDELGQRSTAELESEVEIQKIDKRRSERTTKRITNGLQKQIVAVGYDSKDQCENKC